MVFSATANTLDAIQTLLLFIEVTRTCGVLEGGIFSISMAVAYQMVVIGRYGMRDIRPQTFALISPFQRIFCPGLLLLHSCLSGLPVTSSGMSTSPKRQVS